MNKYTSYFYTTTDNNCPVEEFLNSLDQMTWIKFIIKKELLEEFGPLLRYPHTDELSEGILELRFSGKEGNIRVLFFFVHGKRIIFTNGFVKKVQKTPPREIQTAIKRKNDWLSRFKENIK